MLDSLAAGRLTGLEEEEHAGWAKRGHGRNVLTETDNFSV